MGRFICKESEGYVCPDCHNKTEILLKSGIRLCTFCLYDCFFNRRVISRISGVGGPDPSWENGIRVLEDGHLSSTTIIKEEGGKGG